MLDWRPDVLVADIGMPEEDGYSFLRRVRTLSAAEGGAIPAAALTAYAQPEDRDRALAAGFQEHLPKPVLSRTSRGDCCSAGASGRTRVAKLGFLIPRTQGATCAPDPVAVNNARMTDSSA